MEFLRRGRSSHGGGIEQQALAGPSTQPEMEEGTRPRPRRLPGTRPSLSSRHRIGNGMQRLDGEESDTPKTPRFSLGLPTLPGTRLNLPHLTRTWTGGSNSPDSRPSSNQQHLNQVDEVSPESAIPRAGGPPTAPVTIPAPVARAFRSESTGRTRRFTGPDPAEMHLAQMAQEGRRRRRRANRRQQQDNDEGHPKRFLLCIPWPKSRRMRSQILRCFISGFFLSLLLVVCKCDPTLVRLNAVLGRELVTNEMNRPSTFPFKKHTQWRVHGAFDTHHLVCHRLLLPWLDSTLHACHTATTRIRAQAADASTPAPRWLRCTSGTYPSCAGARRRGTRGGQRGGPG